MGPAPTSLDTMLPTSSSSLFNIPKLAEDGTNWITYKERMLTAIGVRGLMRYIDGRVKQPIPFALSPTTGEPLKADGKPATDVEIEVLDDKLDEFCQKNSSVKQYIFSVEIRASVNLVVALPIALSRAVRDDANAPS